MITSENPYQIFMIISINVMLLTAAVKAFTIFFFCLRSKGIGPHLFCAQANIFHLPDICKNRPMYHNSPTNRLKVI